MSITGPAATMHPREFVEVSRTAVKCRSCFSELGLAPAAIDIAQPRWVGRRYWQASRRTAILLLNPGSGRFREDPAVTESLRALTAFRDGALTIDALFDVQRSDMTAWGRGRFLAYFEQGLGLDFNELAFANVAWCATRENSYPPAMLDRCFRTHTLPALEQLAPHVLLACGSAVHRFAATLAESLAGCTVVACLHYAHREGKAAEEAELRRLATILGRL